MRPVRVDTDSIGLGVSGTIARNSPCPKVQEGVVVKGNILLATPNNSDIILDYWQKEVITATLTKSNIFSTELKNIPTPVVYE